jgi:hypothetical protein
VVQLFNKGKVICRDHECILALMCPSLDYWWDHYFIRQLRVVGMMKYRRRDRKRAGEAVAAAAVAAAGQAG